MCIEQLEDIIILSIDYIYGFCIGYSVHFSTSVLYRSEDSLLWLMRLQQSHNFSALHIYAQ